MTPIQVGPPVSRLAREILQDNPICYWRLNEAVGASTALDQQGVASGTYQSAIANGLGRQGPTQGDPSSGAIGLAVGATGGEVGVGLPSTAAFDVGPPFTIEFMVMTKATGASTLVELINPSGSGNGYGVGIGHTTTGEIDVHDSSNSTWPATGVTVNDGAWHHVVIVFSGATVTTYKDGTSAGSITLSAAPTPYSGSGMQLLSVGSNSLPFYMSECAAYDAVLSSARVAAHYNSLLNDAPTDRIELLTATVGWEGSAVVEPNLYWDGALSGGTGKWCMIYRGSWSSEALGYATSSNSDPTIPGDWTKYASNPIIGNGHGGASSTVYCPSIYIESGTLYVYWTDLTSGDIYMDSGPDALHLSGSPLKVLTHTTGVCGNTWIVKNGSTYVLFFEMKDGTVWHIGYAICSTIDGTYDIQTYPITGLEISGETSQSGPWATIQDGECILWFHSSTYSGTDLPSRIFRTTTSDLSGFATWTPPVEMIRQSEADEYDQVADVELVIPGNWGAPSTGPAYALWDGDNNVQLNASIFINRTGIMPVAA